MSDLKLASSTSRIVVNPATSSISIVKSGPVGPAGGIVITPQATPVNVKDYGAIGNGIYDDTSAIQNAINACNDSGGGGTVYFPSNAADTPYVVSTLYMPDRVGLCGETPTVTIKKKASTTGPVITSATPTTGGYQVVFANLIINGNRANAPSGTDGIGQHPSASSTEGFIGQAVIFHNVVTEQCVRDGIRLGLTTDNKQLHVFNNVRSTYNGGNGISVFRGTDLWMDQVWVAENGLAAMWLHQCSAARLHAVQFEGNDNASFPIARSANRPLLRLSGSTRILAIGAGCTFSSGCRAIHVQGDVSTLSITGGTWINGNNGDNGTYPAIEFAAGINIDGVFIDDSVRFHDDTSVNVGTSGRQSHYIKFGTPASVRDVRISGAGMAISNLGTSPVTGVVVLPTGYGLFDNGGCSLTKTADQTITSGSFQVVTFGSGSENYDPDNLHSTSSNTHIIPVRKPGLYAVDFSGMWADAASGDRIADLVCNSITVVSHRSTPTPGSRGSSTCSWTGYLPEGALVWAQVYQDAGSDRVLDYASLSIASVG